jgi:hypothetical protein
MGIAVRRNIGRDKIRAIEEIKISHSRFIAIFQGG